MEKKTKKASRVRVKEKGKIKKFAKLELGKIVKKRLWLMSANEYIKIIDELQLICSHAII